MPASVVSGQEKAHSECLLEYYIADKNPQRHPRWRAYGIPSRPSLGT